MVQMPALNTPQFELGQEPAAAQAAAGAADFQPEVAAEAIVWAAGHDRRELYVGWPSVEAIVGNKVAPGWLDHYLARHGIDSQMTDEPADLDRPNNLWEPVNGVHRTHGQFDDRSSGSSWQLWAAMNRGWLAAAGGCLAGLAPAGLISTRR